MTEKETTMRIKAMRTYLTLALMLVGGFVAPSLTVGGGVASVSASSERSRPLHVTKECSEYTGGAGSFCTITSSNLRRIPAGSRAYYDQAAGVPAGLLDSNVVLDAGKGNRALGRCTLDLTTGLGLCTFSDGTGNLAGFRARVEVDCTAECRWDGAYSFADLSEE
jgi:hypothetical protein